MTRHLFDDGASSSEGAPSRTGAIDLSLSVDDVWLAELAAELVTGLERLLAAHAAFAVWCDHRQDVGHDEHDG